MAWYATGTVSVTNNSATVTGVGTAWIANASAGMGFRAPNRELYEIASVNSDTSLTLATVYSGSTAATQAYSLLPTQDYIRSLAASAASLVTSYSTIATNAGVGKFGAGTVSLPGITNGADTDTGLYFPSANTLSVTTSGVERARFDSAGRLNVGTTPASVSASGINLINAANSTYGLLFVKDTTAASVTVQPGIFLQRDGGSTGYASPSILFDVGSGGGNAEIYTVREGGPGGNLVISTDTTGGVMTERMRITSGGLVGIGMTPAAVLDITKNGNASSVIQLLNSDAGIGADARLTLNNGTDTCGMIMRGTGNTLASQGTLFVSGATNPLVISTNGFERTRWDGATGDILHTGQISLSRASNSTISRTNTSGYLSLSGGANINDGPNIQLGGSTSPTFPNLMLFRLGSTERARIDASGNLLIGVTTGNRRLTVGADASAAEYIQMRTSSTGSTGILFNDDGGTTNYGAVMYEHTTDAMSFRVANAEAARFSASGSLGLGFTATPSERLELVGGGNIRVNGVTSGYGIVGPASSTGGIKIQAYQTGTTAFLDLDAFPGTAADSSYLRVFRGSTGASAASAFAIYSPGTVTETFKVLATTGNGGVTGNFGAGTLSPGVRFEAVVAGTAGASQVKVRNDTDAGYGMIQYIGSTFATTSRQNNMEIVTGGASSDIAFLPNGTEKARLTVGGQLLLGTDTAQSPVVFGSAGTFTHQVSGTSSVSSGYLATRFAGVTAASAPAYVFARSRGSTDGSMTITASGDTLGYLSWTGSDGATFQEAARIVAQVDGTPGTTDMPGRIVFYTTPDASATPAERMRIDKAGLVGIGKTPAEVLDVASSTGRAHFYLETTAATQTAAFRMTATAGSAQWTMTAGTGSANVLTFTSAGGEAMRLDNAGIVQVGQTTAVGDAKIQVSNGVRFGGTASSNANTLDYYEEGTFTPVVVGTTTAGAGTYTGQIGSYSRIGNSVRFSLSVTWTAHTGAGNIAINGLPFTTKNTNNLAHFFTIAASNLTFSGQLDAWANNNVSQILIGSTATAAAHTQVALDTAATIWITGDYEV